jgi:hypothetical protein
MGRTKMYEREGALYNEDDSDDWDTSDTDDDDKDE